MKESNFFRTITFSLFVAFLINVLPSIPAANAVSGTLIGYGSSVPTPPHGSGGNEPEDFECTNGYVVVAASVQAGAGAYSTGFKFECSPLTSELTVGSTIETTTAQNLDVGEDWATSRCSSGLVAYGFRGNEGTDGGAFDNSFFFNDIGLNCFDPFLTNGGSVGALANGYSRNILTSNCTSSGFITGFSLRMGDGIDRVTPICRDFESTRSSIRAKRQAEIDSRERQRKNQELQEILISVLAIGSVSSALTELIQVVNKAPTCKKGTKVRFAKNGNCPQGFKKVISK